MLLRTSIVTAFGAFCNIRTKTLDKNRFISYSYVYVKQAIRRKTPTFSGSNTCLKKAITKGSSPSDKTSGLHYYEEEYDADIKVHKEENTRKVDLSKLSFSNLDAPMALHLARKVRAGKSDSQEIIDWVLQALQNISFTEITPTQKRVLVSIIRSKKNSRELIQWLPKKLHFENLSQPQITIYTEILQIYGPVFIFPKRLDLHLLQSDEQMQFITTCIGNGYKDEVIKLLPPDISTKIDTSPFSSILVSLARSGEDEAELVKNILPKDLDLTNPEIAIILRNLCQHNQGRYVYETLKNARRNHPSILDFSVSLIYRSLLSQRDSLLPKEKQDLEIFVQRSMDAEGNLLRQPTEVSLTREERNHFSQKRNTVLLEEIMSLKAIIKKVSQEQNGWRRAKIDKTGSTTDVYIKMDAAPTLPVQIIFRNAKIPQESMLALEKAQKFLPGFVSSSVYPEVDATDQELRFPDLAEDLGSFREVYAGITIQKFQDLDPPLPAHFINNVMEQVSYIQLGLSLYGIHHGHAHAGNFNVRFLLTGEDGQQQLLFDPYDALVKADEKSWKLTPIVTLRDWDRAQIE